MTDESRYYTDSFGKRQRLDRFDALAFQESGTRRTVLGPLLFVGLLAAGGGVLFWPAAPGPSREELGREPNPGVAPVQPPMESPASKRPTERSRQATAPGLSTPRVQSPANTRPAERSRQATAPGLSTPRVQSPANKRPAERVGLATEATADARRKRLAVAKWQRRVLGLARDLRDAESDVRAAMAAVGEREQEAREAAEELRDAEAADRAEDNRRADEREWRRRHGRARTRLGSRRSSRLRARDLASLQNRSTAAGRAVTAAERAVRAAKAKQDDVQRQLTYARTMLGHHKSGRGRMPADFVGKRK